MSKPSHRSRLFSVIAVTCFIVVFPLVSWYYLDRGVHYRMNSLSKLDSLGAWPALIETDILTNSVYPKDSLDNRIGIIAFPDYDDAKTLESLTKLHNQFDERDDIKFMLYFPPIQPNERWRPYPLQDKGQVLQFRPNNYAELNTAYRRSDDRRLLTYVDYKGNIRKHYNAHDLKDMQDLVEHVTMLLPRVKKDTVALVRDKH